MKAFKLALYRIVIISTIKFLIIILSLTVFKAFSQSLTAEFAAAGYTLTDLGSITNLPPQNGGLTIRPSEPNTLYIGGNANSSNAALYAVPLVRDPFTQHITGFGGPASSYVNTPNIDGGVLFAANGTLLFTRYSMNALGQILPDNTYISTSLTQYGVNSSVGSLAIVPAGYPGAGNLIFSSYNASILYRNPYTIDASGAYTLSNQTAQVNVQATASSPEGIAYIPSGSSAFPNLSMAISSYSRGVVVVFEVGPNGLPDVLTARDMVVGLTGAEGALIDPVTGDFLFSTFGGGNKVIRISGFEPPATYLISASAGPTGNINPEGEVEVMEGADQLFLITANPGYQIADVLVDGISVGAVNQYEFTNVVANHTIHASLAAIAGPPDWTPVPNLQYNMQIVAKLQLAEGTFSVNENDIVAGFVGEECRGLVSPMAALDGMLFLTIGSNQQSGETVNFKAYLADQDLIVDLNESFEFVSMAEIGDFLNPFIFTFDAEEPPATYVISASAEPNGNIDPEGEVEVMESADQLFLITANPGYQIADVLVDGISVGAVNQYEFTNVVANHTIHASFAAITGPPDWTPVPNLQYNMQIVAKLKLADETFSVDENDIVAGFVGEECRGLVSPMVALDGMLFLTIGSNQQSGETVIFKAYLANQDLIVDLNESFEFVSMAEIGDFLNPFIFTFGATETLPGDANGDGVIDVLDVIAIINYVLDLDPEPFIFENADINGDGVVDVLDAIAVINIILGGEKFSNPEIIVSEKANLYLRQNLILLESDGTLTGLQFELIDSEANMLNPKLLLDEFMMHTNVIDDKLKGIIFHPENKPIPAGTVELISLQDASGLKFGEVFAGNINAQKVKVNQLELAPEEAMISVYPNPSQGQFKVRIALPEKSEIQLVLNDLAGREMHQYSRLVKDTGIHELTLSPEQQLKSGIYILQMIASPVFGIDATHTIKQVKLVILP